MRRTILASLARWKQNPGRKPLILKGARQVGKTFVLKEFGRQHFAEVHYLNFEKESQFSKTFFEASLDPRKIIPHIEFYLDTKINTQTDLLIFDEIQECPPALTSLKYFQEELSEFAVCAAGSLLGVHLNTASFPVGKVDFLNMYPLSFTEFLEGIGDNKSVEYIHTVTPNSQTPTVVHEHLWQRLKQYFVVGGLPEVVETFRQDTDLFTAFEKVRIKQNALIHAYSADIAKHAGKVNAMHIHRTWHNIPAQLARSEDGFAHKFQFKHIIPGIDRYSRLANVFDWLSNAGLVIKNNILETIQFPLSAYVKENTFKLFLFDVGLLGAMSELSPSTIMNKNYGTFKGYFAENFIAQSLLCAGNLQLYSWQEGNAEVEFLFKTGESVIPIEVKSGTVVHAKSLKQFTEKYCPTYRAIFSARPLLIDVAHHIHFYPLYLIDRFPLE